MSISINILENGEGVEILAIGVVHGQEIIRAHDQIYDYKNIKKQKYHIIDKSKCTEYDVTAEDIASISKLDEKASKINPNIIIAIIESESLQFSLTELWQARVEDYVFDTKSFRDRKTAVEWIKNNKHKT